jgi:hypothetical protein
VTTPGRGVRARLSEIAARVEQAVEPRRAKDASAVAVPAVESRQPEAPEVARSVPRSEPEAFLLPPTSARPRGAQAREKRPGRGREETLVWSATTQSGQVVALGIRDLGHGERAAVWSARDAGWGNAVLIPPRMQADALAAFTSAVGTIGGTRSGAVPVARTTSWKIPEPEPGRRGSPPAHWWRVEGRARAVEAASRGGAA